MKSYKFKNCGQILCTHTPYFLMPGHIKLFCQLVIMKFSNRALKN